MCCSLLKLNENKIEVILFGLRQRWKSCCINMVNMAGCLIKPVKSIGVQQDSHMTLECQVNRIVSVAWYHLRSIFLIRKYWTQNATEAVTSIHAFISSKLDLNNALLFGISAGLIETLQTVQNAAAGAVVHADRYTSAKPIPKKLHRLVYLSSKGLISKSFFSLSRLYMD